MLYLLVIKLIILFQELRPEKPESIWPTSVAGYVGFTAAIISISVITYDRITGRASNWRDVKRDIQDLCTRVEREEAATHAIDDTLGEMDQLLTGIDHELRGVGGDNGIRSAVREIQDSIKKINTRNTAMDLKAAVFEQIIKQTSYTGPERRDTVREMKHLFGDKEQST